MRQSRPIVRRLRVLAVPVILITVYLCIVFLSQLRWGATTEERGRSMPGDGMVSDPIFVATRAITIHARPEDIWPRLVQMGYNRAGFYG